MKHFRFLAMLLVAATLVFTACSDDGGSTPAVTYAIGDTGPSGVGIVFYVTDGGLHGLEAAPADQSSSVWSNHDGVQITPTGTAIGTGSANTDDIINQGGHTDSAAQICRDYRAAEEGDWFLPSQDELNKLFDNKNAVGGFENLSYWSSSENSSNTAHLQDFEFGVQDLSEKSNHKNVRAIRAF